MAEKQVRRRKSPEVADREALEHFETALSEGRHWFTALLEAVALWCAPEEDVGERHYRYLIDGEAFDWLLLAERLTEAIDGGVSPSEREALLFFDRPPLELADGEFKRLIGPAKYRAHLNFLYGVVVEEALQLAVEEEVHKERRARVWDNSGSLDDAVFERVYAKGRQELLSQFREERSRPQGDSIYLDELRQFTYWLFKYRLRRCDGARVASDT
ncbi:MAG: hypothetical protein A2148_02045, partial [Chloroflexi bacterium RBG_16_68_14]